MNAVISKTFKSGNSVAVRLPKAAGIPAGVEVSVTSTGWGVNISPVRPSVKDMLRKLRALPPPSDVEVRDPDIFPERGVD